MHRFQYLLVMRLTHFFLTQQLQQLPATSVRTGRLFLTLHNKSSDTAQPFTD